MVPTQISCFFFPKVFLRQVFSGLCSNRTSIVGDYSAPLLLSSFVVVLFTRIFSSLLPGLNGTIYLYFGFLVQGSGQPGLTGMICLSMGFFSNVADTPA